MYEGYERLKFERDGSILTIRISNPDARNAVDGRMHEELPRAFIEVAGDRHTRVVVLTGDPQGKAFCAGGDIKWLEKVSDDSTAFVQVLREGYDIIRNMADAPQPIISMLNGHAMGLGATIALCSDIQFMSEQARIGDPHVSVGVVAGDGGAVIWPLLIGPNRAKEYLMTGDAITAADAERMGLVNHVVAPEQLEAETYALARRLAEGPRLAIELTKKSVNLLVRQVIDQVLIGSLALEGLTFNTADHREAVRAFKAKEKPNFGQG